MPHSNPTPDQIQAMTELIAELQGWTKIQVYSSGFCPEALGGFPPGSKNFKTLPSWLSDRNASLGLIKDHMRSWYGNALSAYNECIIYLEEIEGYCWVECHTCRGSGKACKHDKLGFCGNEKHKVPCPACSGQGGKFVKEVTDE